MLLTKRQFLKTSILTVLGFYSCGVSAFPLMETRIFHKHCRTCFYGRVLNFNTVDSVGEIFPSDVKLVEFKSPVPLVHQNEKIGLAFLTRTDAGIDARLSFNEGTSALNFLRYFPAVSGIINKREGMHIRAAQILAVELSPLKNCDRTIKSLIDWDFR